MNPALNAGSETGPGRASKKKPEEGGGDRYIAKQREQKRLKRQEEEARRLEAEAVRKQTVDLEAKIKPFDEGRKCLVLEFFASHFVRMAEKSNEFRSRGQSFMYLQQSENLLALLRELGHDGRKQVSDLEHDIFRLRENVNYPMYLKDYWNIRHSNITEQ